MGEKGLSFRLVANASSIPTPHSPPASKAQDTENIHFHGLGETVTIFGDDSTLSAHILPITPVDEPNWEALDVLLERFPTFTNMEPLASHMNKLFPIMERVPVDVTTDPQQNFMACVLHGTSSETIEVIIHLKDYSAM